MNPTDNLLELAVIKIVFGDGKKRFVALDDVSITIEADHQKSSPSPGKAAAAKPFSDAWASAFCPRARER
jgi:hypothetical protein